MKKKTFLFLILLIPCFAQIIETEGRGFLEKTNGQKVLHLKGEPYEMGFQHGRLMSLEIQENIEKYLNKSNSLKSEKASEFSSFIPTLLSNLPKKYVEEMQGVADGANVDMQKIVLLNLFPEMFHCSALTAKDNATTDGKLYHVRVLDYSVGKGLQKSAVVIIQKPNIGNGFVNISYAGFIGSVSGMNDQKISVGEIGAKGYGKWNGMPMTFIMREILENASTLVKAKKILQDVKRTCHYFYIVSDGKINDSFAAFAAPEKISFIKPGVNYKFSAFIDDDMTVDRPFFQIANEKINVVQSVAAANDSKTLTVLQGQLKDVLSLTGFNYKPYPILYQRLEKYFGNINEETIIEIIKRPVARKSNLHNVIFIPSNGDFWVANAGENNEPACDQNYFLLNIFELLQR